MRKRRGKKTDHPVKPITVGIWYWWCDICCKKYIKDDAHASCYDRFCILCEMSFKDVKLCEAHIERYHSNERCDICNQLFIDFWL